LSRIDFEKGNISEQLKALQTSTNSKAYTDKMAAQLNTMTMEERANMGSMMMAAMMSPLYARIYYTDGKVLAKANAMNYSMESLMNIKDGTGNMVVISNDKSKEAAIEFSAANMKKVWEKEEIDADKYEMKFSPDQEQIAGYWCKKVTYTYKERTGIKSVFGKQAYKVIVWYSPEINQDINFLHPFYFQLDKGILKIEVHYDKGGKCRMLYEVTGIEPKSLSEKDFLLTPVEPVVNWDTNQITASMNILNVIMSGSGRSN
jgi:hypothetical protein